MITDLGERCDRHGGETYLPRCYDCTDLQVFSSEQVEAVPIGTPGTSVPPVDNSTPDVVTTALASWGLTSEKSDV